MSYGWTHFHSLLHYGAVHPGYVYSSAYGWHFYPKVTSFTAKLQKIFHHRAKSLVFDRLILHGRLIVFLVNFSLHLSKILVLRCDCTCAWHLLKNESDLSNTHMTHQHGQKFGVGKMFLKEVSYSHQSCIYLLWKTVLLWNILKTAVFYLNIL